MALAWRPTLVTSLLPALASGHGFLTKPEMRGGATNNEENGFCPQCLGSTDLPMDTCGNANFLNVVEPVTELRAGEMAELEVKVTAHHKGHFVFRLCDQALSNQTGGFQKEEECLNKHVLKRARPEEVHDDCQVNDQRGDCQPYDEANPGHWYLPPPTWPMTYRIHYWIPSNLTCERCTLQWWWMSANSCTPHEDAYICFFQEMERQGWNVDEWCPRGGTCSFSGTCPAVQRGPSLCGEQFKNCADVRIVDDGSTRGPTLAPAPTPPTPPATPAPTRAPTVGGVCVHETSCNKSDWCNDASYTDWCPLHSTSECPSPQCFVSGAQPSPIPSPSLTTVEPTASPTAEPGTAAPTVSPPTPAPAGGGACTGEPCLNGAHCRSHLGYCGSGAPWCNDKSTWKAGGCGPTLLEHPRLVEARHSQARKHTFLGLLQTASPLSRSSAYWEL